MFGVVTIGDREIEMAANATTAIRYGQVFHGEDLLVYFTKGFKTTSESIYVAQKLGYIMARAAEKADMNKLSEDGFIDWLEDFPPMAFVDSAEEILNAYMDQTEGTATP